MERYHPSDPLLPTARPAAPAAAPLPALHRPRRTPRIAALPPSRRRPHQTPRAAAPPQSRRRPFHASLTGLLAAAALVSAACTGHHRPATTAGDASLPFARGTASWYGAKFNGRRTASGERYDMHALTAAHPTLPFGTLVAVTNLDNGRQVVVRINDRGPFKRQRVIDLSYAAARDLDMIGPGSAEVQLAIVGRPESPPPAPEPAPVLIAAAAPPTAAWDAAAAAVPDLAPTAARPAALPDADAPAAAPAVGEPRPTHFAAGDGGALHYTVQVGAFGELDRATNLEQRLAARYPEVAVHSDGTWHRVQIGAFDERDAAEALRRELAALGLAAIVVAAH